MYSPASNDPTQKSPGIIRGSVSMELAISDRPLCCSLNTNLSGGLKTSPTVQAGPGSHWRCGISDLSSTDRPYVRRDALRLRPSALSTQQSATRPGRPGLSFAWESPFYTTGELDDGTALAACKAHAPSSAYRRFESDGLRCPEDVLARTDPA